MYIGLFVLSVLKIGLFLFCLVHFCFYDFMSSTYVVD